MNNKRSAQRLIQIRHIKVLPTFRINRQLLDLRLVIGEVLERTSEEL